MTLAFLSLSGSEVILIACSIAVIIAIGNYGRNTQLGYTGSVLLSLLASPLIGFAVVYYLKSRNDS